MLYSVHSAHSSIARANTKHTNYEHATREIKSTVPINHITVLRVLAGKDLHEGMIIILFRSSFHVSLQFMSVLYIHHGNCGFHNPKIP